MKIITGKVISTNMAKTAIVLVERNEAHPQYKKRIRLNKKYHVHDEMESQTGDIVRFVGCKPMSKTKKWKIVEVVGRKAVKKEKVEAPKEEKTVKVKTAVSRKAKK